MIDTMMELSDRDLDMVAAGCDDSGSRDTDQNAGLVSAFNADHGSQGGLANVNVNVTA